MRTLGSGMMSGLTRGQGRCVTGGGEPPNTLRALVGGRLGPARGRRHAHWSSAAEAGGATGSAGSAPSSLSRKCATTRSASGLRQVTSLVRRCLH